MKLKKLIMIRRPRLIDFQVTCKFMGLEESEEKDLQEMRVLLENQKRIALEKFQSANITCHMKVSRIKMILKRFRKLVALFQTSSPTKKWPLVSLLMK